MAPLVLVGTHGADDPTKAVLPFVLAAGAAKAKGADMRPGSRC